MSSQIFKNSPPANILFTFLDSVCEKKQNKYILTKAVFKKSQIEKKITPFIELLKPHYFNSKLFYIERPMVYKNFVTIVRQYCKYYDIGMISSIKYNRSKYEIHYSIFMPKQLINV
jgi:hypothetical protein